MTNDKTRIDKLGDTVSKYFPERIDPVNITIAVWKMAMDFKIEMLRRDGFSDKFIDKWIERQCDLFAKELVKEREA